MAESDIYGFLDAGPDNIKDRNEYPKTQPEEIQRPSNPEGDVVPETVDHFQQHVHKEQWNEATGIMSLYDPNNPDRQYMDIIETEVIALTSPPIKYYKLRHQGNNIDPLYGESTRRDAYEMPTTIYGNYESPSIETELVQFGLKDIEELELWFNYNHLVNTIGDKLQIGDILQTYDARLWEVMTSTLINESLWRAQHNHIFAKRLNTEGIWLPDKPRIDRTPNVPKV
jgi:hypothetical protein